MATNKHAIIRYQTLDKCFRNPGRKYFIDDLIAECNKAIFDLTGKPNGIKRRQIYDDISFMQSEQGWSVQLKRYNEGRKVYLRYQDSSYSINNSPLNNAEEQQLKEALLTLSRLKGMPQFNWIEEITTRINAGLDSTNQSSKVIEFDQNQYLKGIEFINPLYQAIISRKTISIKYQSFKQEKPQTIIFHPYFLKQYNNRWFLFGLNNDYKNISNLALDRILSLEETDTAFEKNESIDFEEYFEDMIGVTVPEGEKPQKILLKITASLWPYIKTKPLHGSQKIKEMNESHTLVELNLIINYELISLLFSYAENITVLEPIILKDQIKAKANRLMENYF